MPSQHDNDHCTTQPADIPAVHLRYDWWHPTDFIPPLIMQARSSNNYILQVWISIVFASRIPFIKEHKTLSATSSHAKVEKYGNSKVLTDHAMENEKLTVSILSEDKTKETTLLISRNRRFIFIYFLLSFWGHRDFWNALSMFQYVSEFTKSFFIWDIVNCTVIANLEGMRYYS